jgi:hypothetical protein
VRLNNPSKGLSGDWALARMSVLEAVDCQPKAGANIKNKHTAAKPMTPR